MGRNVTQQPIPYTPLVAGETIAAGDVISQYASDNKAYTSKYLPFATTANQGSAIYNYTGLTINTGGTQVYTRYPIVQISDGSVFTVEPYANNYIGLVVKKTNNDGVLLSSVTLITTGTYSQIRMFSLSNGDIAIVANVSATTAQYAIVTTNLAVTKVLTSTGLTAASGGSKTYAMPSTSGGFTVITSNAANIFLATINNAGTITTASTSILTVGSTALIFSAVMLSNGNIALSQTNDSGGTSSQYAVYTTTAVAVKAWTSLPSGQQTTTFYSDITSLTGYFAVVYPNATGNYQTIAVFNNAGTQQGTQVLPIGNVTLNTSGLLTTYKFFNDGTNFYWVDGQSSTIIQTAKITTASVNTLGPAFTPNNNSFGFDAYYDTKSTNIVLCKANSGGFYNINLIPTTSFSSTSFITSYTFTIPSNGYGTGYGGIAQSIDGSILLADMASTNLLAMYNGSIKPYNSSIIGVAAGAATAGSTVYVNSAVANYSTTTALTTNAKKFNHSAAPILGAAGQVFPNTINIQTPTIRNIN